MTEPVGSDAWLTRVFDTDVRDELFTGHTPGHDAPILVLLGGQPAAGKTRAQQAFPASMPLMTLLRSPAMTSANTTPTMHAWPITLRSRCPAPQPRSRAGSSGSRSITRWRIGTRC